MAKRVGSDTEVRNDHFQDITVAGNISVGAQSTLEGNLVPDGDDSRDLGSSTNRFRNLYLVNIPNQTETNLDTIRLGNSTQDVVLSRQAANVLQLASGDDFNPADTTGQSLGDSTHRWDAVLDTATVGSLNSILSVDGVKYATIASALAALPAAGGRVVLRENYTETLTSALQVGSATQVVELVIPKSAVITINTTGGVDAIQVYSKSSIISEGSNAADSQIVVSATANISSAIASYPRSGAQSIQNIRGLTIRGNTGMTVSRAMLDLVAVTDSSTFEGVVIHSFPGTIGLLVENASGLSVGPVNFTGITVNGAGLTGARPVVIRAAVTNGVMHNINFFGGSLAHPGTGGLKIVEIDGGTNNQIASANFYGTQIESENSGDIGIYVEEATGVNVDGVLFTAGAAAGADCIKIANGSGVAYNLIFTNITNFNAWTNTINDTARSVTITDARVGNYTVLPPSTGSWHIVSDTGSLLKVSNTGALTLRGDVILERSAADTLRLATGDNFIPQTTGQDFGATGTRWDAFLEQTSAKRYKADGGTALVAGDFALSAGWGTTASVGTITGTDQGFQFTVTSSGTGQGANPTITVTDKDGTWTNAPIVLVKRSGGNQLTIADTWTVTATALTITFNGTPVAAETFTYNVIKMGR